MDTREHYYRERLRHHGQRYLGFHWSSVGVLFDLACTYDLVTSHLTRMMGAPGPSLSAFNTLMILSRSDSKGCPLHEISELLLVSRVSVTGLINSLERKGWLRAPLIEVIGECALPSHRGWRRFTGVDIARPLQGSPGNGFWAEQFRKGRVQGAIEETASTV